MFNNYEIVEYTHSLPFQIQNFTGRTIQDDRGDIKDVLEHWHQEIEMPHAGDYDLEELFAWIGVVKLNAVSFLFHPAKIYPSCVGSSGCLARPPFSTT